METIRVGIYGAGGYAGIDLVVLLSKHSNVTLQFATSNTYAGKSVTGTSLSYISHTDADLSTVDVVFLALPHTVSAPVVKQAQTAGVRVVDLSADMRLDSETAFETWYQTEHPHPELLQAPYALPEINRQALVDMDICAVPGCYPTATLLGLYPLLRLQALHPTQPIIVDAKSGVSGAGRNPKPNTHFVAAYGNVSPYNIGRVHRHVGEIEQEIHKLQTQTGDVFFTPHLVPVDRGLMSSITVAIQPEKIAASDVHALYEETYAPEPLVHVNPAGKHANLHDIANKNTCVMSVQAINDTYIHITSVLDNLRKGAASQAVQAFNLMHGFDETTALV